MATKNKELIKIRKNLQDKYNECVIQCLHSNWDEFTENNKVKLIQGQAVFFASFIKHRVAPVTRGVRKSLVMWFGGPPLR